MTALHRAVPDVDVLLALEPEEVGWVILSVWDQLIQNELLHREALVYFDENRGIRDVKGQNDQVFRALNEGFYWLLHQGIIVPTGGSSGTHGFCVLSRRGNALRDRAAFVNYRRASLLPREMIHASLLDRVWPLYLRGDHDAAVLNSYIAVEIAVRTAAGLPAELVGVQLMRRAFHAEEGALSDKTIPVAEREGILNLFAGAIGSFKNPLSHRNVGLDASRGSAEMIVLASHLLRIVDERVAQRAAAKVGEGN